MEKPHFIAHNKDDCCAVAVVEGVEKHNACKVWNMETDDLYEVKVLNDIPIGHKIALRDLAPDDTIVKYGADIGKTIANVATGEHLHTHNLKTKRW